MRLAETLPADRGKSRLVARLALGFLLIVASVAWSQLRVPSDVLVALNRISADSLRESVAFLASDLPGGRYTPSPGLDAAADYIAAGFRRAGLEPGGDEGYFQTAAMVEVTPSLDGFEFLFESARGTIRVPQENLQRQGSGPVHITRAPVVKVTGDAVAALATRSPGQARGKVLLVTFPVPKPFPWSALAPLEPALVVLVGDGVPAGGQAAVHLRYPDDPEPPWLFVQDPALCETLDRVKSGPLDASITVRMAAPTMRPVRLRNVVGVVRGSDASLKNTYVLVTAHYDDVGQGGANDNASGAAAIMDLGAAFAALREKPKRSVVFATFFGEERGKMGSRHYGLHPLFPPDRTVVDVNLEQLGRTDDSEGSQIARASLSGFDYSDVGRSLRQAGELVGVTIFRHKKYSDLYFRSSDSSVFADMGIPSHTLFVAYDFAGYHTSGDRPDKLDYGNMEKITRAVALGVLAIADSSEPPRWNETNRKVTRYVQAWKLRHGNR